MKKKIAIIALSAVLLVPTTQAFAASVSEKVWGKSSVHFIVDGKEYAPPAEQVGGFVNSKGSTYVPLRFVASILKKNVGWDGKTRKVTVSDPTEEDMASIEAYLVEHEVKNSKIEPIGKLKEETITIDKVEVNYEFQGKAVKPGNETPGFMINNSVYVPLRFMYESLGYEPKWDGKTYTVSVDKEKNDIELTYYNKLQDFKGELFDEATAILAELGTNFIKVNNGDITEEQKAQIIEKGEPFIAESRTELAALLDELTSKLEEKGYTTEKVEKFQTEFDNLEKLVRKNLGLES